MTDTPKTFSRRSSLLSTFLGTSKKKLAPRSSLQFKVGPQFSSTLVENKIINSKGEQITPIITPRIDRGFEIIDDEWVGYKRNYFTLVSAFYFSNMSFLKFAGDKFFTIDPETNQKIKIEYFAMRLTSKCADDGTHVVLVQHTAKRDRGPQMEPPTHPAVPGDLPDHTIIREAANVRNTSKIAKLNKVFFFDKADTNNGLVNTRGLLNYPNDKIIKVARYERIQFSSSINYKKPSINNKRFKLYVELVGYTGEGNFVPLAYTETPPLIVRGRSPSNYQGSEAGQISTEIDSTMHSTPLENLNDYDTYQILKIATEGLHDSPSIEPAPKKKRGRKPKPKPKSNTPIVKRQKVSKPQTKKAKGKVPKVQAGNEDSAFDDASDEQFTKFIDDSFLSPFCFETPDLNDDNQTFSPFPNMAQSKIDIHGDGLNTYELEDSTHLVDLFNTQMHYSGIDRQPLASITNTGFKDHQLSALDSENYDAELIQLKGHVKKDNDQDPFQVDFSEMTPSGMLNTEDYEEGPSFMHYS